MSDKTYSVSALFSLLVAAGFFLVSANLIIGSQRSGELFLHESSVASAASQLSE